MANPPYEEGQAVEFLRYDPAWNEPWERGTIYKKVDEWWGVKDSRGFIVWVPASQLRPVQLFATRAVT